MVIMKTAAAAPISVPSTRTMIWAAAAPWSGLRVRHGFKARQTLRTEDGFIYIPTAPSESIVVSAATGRETSRTVSDFEALCMVQEAAGRCEARYTTALRAIADEEADLQAQFGGETE